MNFFFCIFIFFQVQSIYKHNNIYYPQEQDVPTLLDQHPVSLFIYLKNNNSDSKQFKLILQRLALILEKKKTQIPIFTIMCSEIEESSFCHDGSLIHFPNIRLHYQGEILVYDGEFKLIEIYMWIKQRLIQPYEELKIQKPKLIKKLLKKEQMVYLYYFDPRKENEENFQNFKTLSTINESVHFYYTEDKEIYDSLVDICKEMLNNKLSFKTNITIFQPDHKKCYYYQGSRDYQQQQEFLNQISKHAVRYFDEYSLVAAQEHQIPILVWFVENENLVKFRKDFEEVAEYYHNSMIFCIVNNDTYEGKYRELKIFKDQKVKLNEEISYLPVHNLMVDLGIEKRDWPQIFIFTEDYEDKVDKWKMKSKLTKENLINFIQSFQKGDLIQHLAVQSLKELKRLNKDAKYEHISTLNYEKKVRDKSNVVIWIEGSYELCEECENLFKEFDQTIEELKDNHEEFENLKIFRLNVQLNEFTKIRVSHVPMIVTWDLQKNMHILQDNIHKDSIEQFLLEFIDQIQELPESDLQLIHLSNIL